MTYIATPWLTYQRDHLGGRQRPRRSPCARRRCGGDCAQTHRDIRDCQGPHRRPRQEEKEVMGSAKANL